MTITSVLQCRACGGVFRPGDATEEHARSSGHERFELYVPHIVVCSTCRKEIDPSDTTMHTAEHHDGGWLVKLEDGSLRPVEG